MADAYIVDAVRSPIGRRNGSLSEIRSEELAAQWKSEPILRLRNFLVSQGVWQKENEEQLHRDVAERVRDTVKKYLDTPAPEPAQMFRHLYARLPRAYAWQAAALAEEREARDAAHHAG